MAYHWLRRAGSGQAGVVSDSERPWQLKRVRERIGALRPQLAALKRTPDQGSDEYRILATGFYAGLRETWERLVEELLFNEVIGRFQLGVTTLQHCAVRPSRTATTPRCSSPWTGRPPSQGTIKPLDDRLESRRQRKLNATSTRSRRIPTSSVPV